MGNNPTPPPPGRGRPPGKPNRATVNAREAIARFVDGNVERLTEWLELIAQDSPKDAFNCFMSVIEYNIPKLARTELTGQDGDAIQVETSIPLQDKEILQRYLNQTKGADNEAK